MKSNKRDCPYCGNYYFVDREYCSSKCKKDMERMKVLASSSDFIATSLMPGSIEKIEFMRKRQEEGYPVTHDHDRGDFRLCKVKVRVVR